MKKVSYYDVPVPSLPDEQWALLPLPTVGKYYVSTAGRIYSETRGRILKGTLINGQVKHDFSMIDDNYSFPLAWEGKETVQKGRRGFMAARLIAYTFKRPTNSNDMIVRHLDNNSSNNHIDNLEWVGTDFLMKQMDENGYIHHRSNAKLSIKQVKEVKKELQKYKDGTSTFKKKDDIAAHYGIVPMTLYRIQNGDIWGNIGKVVKKKVTPKKLPAEKVLKIRTLLSEGQLSGREIADKMKLTPTVISRIKQNHYYKL